VRELALATHDFRGLTEKDFTLAKQCGEVFTSRGSRSHGQTHSNLR
jgi:pterin-4a-carbinolamine dehydratase